MKKLHDEIQCPGCDQKIILPVFGKLRMQKLEDAYDLAEQDAQEKLSVLRGWLANASLWGLLRFWLRRITR